MSDISIPADLNYNFCFPEKKKKDAKNIIKNDYPIFTLIEELVNILF